jgi:hypothetical protein
LFLNSDGNLLILKDETKILRDPTDEEIKIYCKPTSKYMLKSNVSKGQANAKKISEIAGKTQFSRTVNKNRIKEQGIQIKVKKEDEKKGPFDIDFNVNIKNSQDYFEKEEEEDKCSENSNLVKYSDEQIKLINEKNHQKKPNNIEIQIFSKNIEDINQNDQDGNEFHKIEDLKK